MLGLKKIFKKKEILFYIFFYSILAILSLTPRFLVKNYSSKSISKSKTIIAFTTENSLDRNFSNLIPYLEPNGMDHFSYTPRRINYIRNIVKKYYGYDLLVDKNNAKDCNYDFYRSSYLNKCLTNDFWKSLTKNEWLKISSETKVNYVVSRITLENLHLCETFINQFNNSEFFYYYIPTNRNPSKYCFQLNKR